MPWVATLSDLWTYGLPGATATPETRQIASVTVAGTIFELPGHAFFGAERVRLKPGVPSSILPTGLAFLSRYLVVPPSDTDFFTITDTSGNAVVITDAGTGLLSLLEDITPKLQALLVARSAWVKSHYKSGSGEWITPPEWAPLVVAQLVAFDVATILRVVSPRYSLDDLRTRAVDAQKFLDTTNAGVPYPTGKGPIDTTPLLVEGGSVAVQLEGRRLLEGWDGDRA